MCSPITVKEFGMLYTQIDQAMNDRNAEAWEDLLHDEFEFVRHQSGTSMNKQEVVAMMRQFMASEGVQEHSRRCVYENDDILVTHAIMDFSDNTRESVIAVYTKKDGKLVRSETGATPMKR